jgi:hypothetical protein
MISNSIIHNKHCCEREMFDYQTSSQTLTSASNLSYESSAKNDLKVFFSFSQLHSWNKRRESSVVFLHDHVESVVLIFNLNFFKQKKKIMDFTYDDSRRMEFIFANLSLTDITNNFRLILISTTSNSTDELIYFIFFSFRFCSKNYFLKKSLTPHADNTFFLLIISPKKLD